MDVWAILQYILVICAHLFEIVCNLYNHSVLTTTETALTHITDDLIQAADNGMTSIIVLRFF